MLNFFKKILTAKLITPVASLEDRLLFSDVNVAKTIHENINKNEPFYFTKNTKKYIVRNL